MRSSGCKKSSSNTGAKRGMFFKHTCDVLFWISWIKLKIRVYQKLEPGLTGGKKMVPNEGGIRLLGTIPSYQTSFELPVVKNETWSESNEKFTINLPEYLWGQVEEEQTTAASIRFDQAWRPVTSLIISDMYYYGKIDEEKRMSQIEWKGWRRKERVDRPWSHWHQWQSMPYHICRFDRLALVSRICRCQCRWLLLVGFIWHQCFAYLI